MPLWTGVRRTISPDHLKSANLCYAMSTAQLWSVFCTGLLWGKHPCSGQKQSRKPGVEIEVVQQLTVDTKLKSTLSNSAHPLQALGVINSSMRFTEALLWGHLGCHTLPADLGGGGCLWIGRLGLWFQFLRMGTGGYASSSGGSHPSNTRYGRKESAVTLAGCGTLF